MTPILFALPWLGVLLFLLFVVKVPSELPGAGQQRAGGPGMSERAPVPLVSVVVPARNESLNIRTCLESLARSTYPSFEIVVVDDRSDDDTAVIARSIARGCARRIVVVDGAELPEGWLGKPWACRQGADVAEGPLLLFTDADTTHGPGLLERAVAAQREDSADLLTIVGRQLMVTFWEKVVQPQVFLTMLFRFPDFERVAADGNWRNAIANGQFMLFPRSSYDAIGGHAAVRDEVVEDLALAQVVKRAGLRLRVRSAETDFDTRMYRSLSDLVAGWSKNIVTGGLQSVPPALRPFVAPASLLSGTALWLMPPLCVALSLAGVLGGVWLAWSAMACSLSVLIFGLFTARMGAPAGYGLLYPLGAVVGTYIFLRSWTRGRDVEWKGRSYRLRRMAERP